MPTYAIALAAAAAALCAIVASYSSFGLLFRIRLGQHATFTPIGSGQAGAAIVEYAPLSHPLLRELRETFCLDAIAGEGADFERLTRLMNWVHGLSAHARTPSRPQRMNGLHLAHLAQEEGKRLNCLMYSTIMNDATLSLGIPSRILYLLPHKNPPPENHVVTAAYCQELGKWVMFDADMNAFVTDPDSAPLGLAEIRRRLVLRQPLSVSDSVDLRYASLLGRRLLKRLYVWYLSKNIFRMVCPVRSEPDYETAKSGRRYMQLIPDGYNDEWLVAPRRTPAGNETWCTRDEEAFWQEPRHGGEAGAEVRSPVGGTTVRVTLDCQGTP